jgi:hypothetical protein
MNSGSRSGDLGAEAYTPVVLATFYNEIEAAIVVAKLRSAGIQCYLRHEAAGVVYGLTVDGMGQQDLMVRADDLEEAQAALEETA